MRASRGDSSYERDEARGSATASKSSSATGDALLRAMQTNAGNFGYWPHYIRFRRASGGGFTAFRGDVSLMKTPQANGAWSVEKNRQAFRTRGNPESTTEAERPPKRVGPTERTKIYHGGRGARG